MSLINLLRGYWSDGVNFTELLQDLVADAFPPKKGLVVTTYDHTSPVSKSGVFKGTNTYGRLYAQALEQLAQKGFTVQSFPVWTLEGDGSRYLDKLVLSMEEMSSYSAWESANSTYEHELEMAAGKIVGRISRMRPYFVIHEPDIFLHQFWHFLRSRYPEPSEKDIGIFRDYLKSQHPEIDEKDTRLTGLLMKSAIDLRIYHASSIMNSAIQSRLYDRLKGRVERVNSESDLGDKGVFYQVAQRLGVPVPKTVVMSNVDDSWWSYKKLAQHLTGAPHGEVIVKLRKESGGKQVYLIKSQSDLEAFIQKEPEAKFSVAQERIPLPSGWPYSIRVVTWQGEPLGAVLLVNSTDGYRSNAKQGGYAIDLALFGREPRTDTLLLDHLQQEEMEKLEAIAALCGIDLKARKLPYEVEELARRIGNYPSGALLRGDDFMYRGKNAPVALESGPHPGPPGTGMFSHLVGKPKQKAKEEIIIGAELIACTIAYKK